MIRFRLTHTPHPLLARPPADDPDLPAPRPPKQHGRTTGTAEHVGVGSRAEQADGALAVFGAEVLGWHVPPHLPAPR